MSRSTVLVVLVGVVVALLALAATPTHAAEAETELSTEVAKGLSTAQATKKAKEAVKRFLKSKQQKANNAAVKVALKLGMINKFKTDLLPSLVDKYKPDLYKREILFDLAGMKKSDMTWGCNTIGCGWQKIQVTSLYVTHADLDFADSKLWINEKGQIHLYLDDVEVKCKGKAKWEGAMSTSYITVKAGVKKLKVSVVIDMHASDLGAPEFQVEYAKGTLRGQDISLDLIGTGIDGLLETIAGWFDDKIAGALTDAIKDNADAGNEMLVGIVDPSLFTYILNEVAGTKFPEPMVVVGGLLNRARRLGTHTRPGSYTALLDFFETTFLASKKQCSCEAKSYPNLGVSPQHVHVRVSEYVMCCALEVAYGWDYLKFYDSFKPSDFVPKPGSESETETTTTKKDGEVAVTDMLDQTAILNNVLPLVKHLTDEYLVYYNVVPLKRPGVSFTRSNGATMKLYLAFNLIAKNIRTKGTTKLAQGSVTIEASLKPFIHKNHIGAGLAGNNPLKVRIYGLKTFFKLIKAETFKPQLRKFVDFLIRKDVVPMVKKLLTDHRYDIALVDGLQFKNPSLKVEDGFLEVATSVIVNTGVKHNNAKDKPFSWDAILGSN